MTDCNFDTPRRDLKPYAEKPALPMILRSAVRLWHRLVSPESRKGVRHLSDHLARDIGLGRNDMARHCHVWPSESTDRPRI